MTPEGAADPTGLAARLELQSTLLEVLRRDVEAARQANEAKDRASIETWRRLRLYEMLLEESRRERDRLQDESRREIERLQGESRREIERLQGESRQEIERLREERDQERARLSDELLHLRSTLSWRITAPLRRIPRPAKAYPASAGGAGEAGPRVEPTPSSHLDFMEPALRHLREKGFRPRVVLDVGAAKGYWSERAGRVFPEAEFYLFDPLKESGPSLLALSDRDPRFRHFLMALGREQATRPMNIARDPEASSLLEFPGQDQAVQREVPVETVDRLLAAGTIPTPDLVKLDVQGFELEVLAGGTRLVEAGCVFIVEVSLFEFMPRCPLAHEVVAYFGERGYRMFDVAGLLRRPFQQDLGQMDMVFVPRDSPLVAESRWS